MTIFDSDWPSAFQRTLQPQPPPETGHPGSGLAKSDNAEKLRLLLGRMQARLAGQEDPPGLVNGFDPLLMENSANINVSASFCYDKQHILTPIHLEKDGTDRGTGSSEAEEVNDEEHEQDDWNQPEPEAVQTVLDGYLLLHMFPCRQQICCV